MKKFFYVFLLMLASSALFAQGQGLPHVAVVQFEENGNIGMKDAGKIIAQWMNSSIIKTGKYQVIERILLKNVLEEQELSSSDLMDPRKAVKLGNLYGAQLIVSGSIIEWQKAYSLSARMIDVATGKVVSSAEYKTKDIQSFPGMMDKIAQVLAGQLPQETLDKASPVQFGSDSQSGVRYNVLQILKVRERNGDTEVVLGGGLDKGMKVGDYYKIYVPRLEKSAITEETAVTGTDEAAVVEITYLEQHLSLARFVDRSKDLKEISARGFAVPAPIMDLKWGVWGRNLPNSAFGAGVSMDFVYPKSIFSMNLGYASGTWYPLWMDLIYKYHLTGISSSAFRISLGAGFGFGGGAEYEYYDTIWNEMDKDDTMLRVTFDPFLELGFSGFFVQGGFSLYYDIGFNDYTDKTYGFVPMIRAGFVF